MHFHRSNRAEELLDSLATLVSDGKASVFAPETIVVQSRGMERWVSMELSRRLGIWANGSFPFPRAWIEDVTSRVLGTEHATEPIFSPDTLQWSIASILPGLCRQPAFAHVARYLRDDSRNRRTLELSAEIARVLDTYVVFRPKLIADWERGSDGRDDDDWQAILWRELIKRHGSDHAAGRAQRLIQALSRKDDRERLPERISLFAVSTLPPLYVELLSQLARHMEVHWFLLSPSREYWADIRPQRDIWSSLSDPALDRVDASDLHLTEGQPLLAAWGAVGRDLVRVIDQRCQQVDAEHDSYHDPGTDSLLHVLQSDMLNLRDRRAVATNREQQALATDCEPLPLAPEDASLTLHACHSEMREVEVLHDQLTHLLETDRTLTPQDILVMAPDIDRYAPLIDAVFGRGDEVQGLPYAISERRAAAMRPTLDAFDAVLDALGSRMPATTVLDLLHVDLIRERFEIRDDELETVVEWVAESGARWAVDEHHRSEVGQPELRENTWRFGLDRLLLGYCFDGDGHELAYGVRPLDDMEGNQTDLLGRFANFCESLFRFRRTATTDHTLAQWRTFLTDVLNTMVARSSLSAADHRTLHEALATLCKRAEATGFDGTIALSSVQQQLRAMLEAKAGSHGFLSSGITFCRMVPMRSIPFRVIALLGMNHDGFPRSDRDGGIDRSKASPQPGDRSARNDDRQLLLEVVLSTRDHLIVTFVGQSVRDNSARPPSVLIDEFLDWCTHAFVLPTSVTNNVSPRERMRQRLVVTHPLQPWSPRYFGLADDPRLFSYRPEHAAGSARLHTSASEPLQFFRHALPAPAHVDAVALRDLEESINDPVRTLLQQRLGIRLGNDALLLEDREPMSLDALDAWIIATPLIELAKRGDLPQDATALLRASGEIPLGAPGEREIERVRRDVTELTAIARSFGVAPHPPQVIDVNLGVQHLHGWVRDRYDTGTVHTTYSKLDSGGELRLWVRHLAINAMPRVNGPRISRLVGRDEGSHEPAVLTFPEMPQEEARELLRDLCRIRDRAMTRPSPFDRSGARAYAVEFLKKGDHAAALTAAKRKTSNFENHYAALAFDDGEALGDAAQEQAFAEVALAVYAPLLQRRVVT